MFFSKRHNFLARFLLISAVALATTPILSESVEGKNLEADSFSPTEELLSEELKSIHQEEVNSVLADGISYSQEERLSDFPDMDSLLREEGGTKRTASAPRISKKKNEVLETVNPNLTSRLLGLNNEMRSLENSGLSVAQSCDIPFAFEPKVRTFGLADPLELGSGLSIKSEGATGNFRRIFSGTYPSVAALAQERLIACAFEQLGLSVSGPDAMLCRTGTAKGRPLDGRGCMALLGAATLGGQAGAMVGTPPEQRAGSPVSPLQKGTSELPGPTVAAGKYSLACGQAAPAPEEKGTEKEARRSGCHSQFVSSKNSPLSPIGFAQKESERLSYIFLSFPEPVKF